MAKTKVNDWDTVASNNTDIGGTSIQGTAAVSNFDNGFRESMAQIAKVKAGTDPIYDTWSFCDPADTTKIARIDCGSISTGTTRVLTMPDADVAISSYAATILNAADAAAALTTLTSVGYGAAQSLTAAQQAQARTNISAALKGHIDGLTLSNNATDATNDIDIAAGEAASTETNPVLMVLGSSLTKRLDAAWVVGTNQGGLDTGTVADNWYYVWLIQRSDTGVVDALFSLSSTAPTMPTNYDRKRLIGGIFRTGGAIKAFHQYGNHFIWDAPALDINAATISTAGALITLTVPPIEGVIARIVPFLSIGSECSLWIRPTFFASVAADGFNTDIHTTGTSTRMINELERAVDGSGQVRYRSQVASVGFFRIFTHGFEFKR